jgi:hypothetical protein
MSDKVMINIDDFLDNISEKNLPHLFEIEKNDILVNDYDSFINFLKANNPYTQYICTTTYEKAKMLLQKTTDCFKLADINIDELYEFTKR